MQTPEPTTAVVRCHVIGAVAAPGVYTLPLGSLVEDAIRAAGGPTAEADLDQLNLTEKVEDQAQIVVPERTDARRTRSLDAPARVGGELININTSNANALQTLPGIGPILAERIIACRDVNGYFETVDDLVSVKGIGEAKLEQLRPLVTVGD